MNRLPESSFSFQFWGELSFFFNRFNWSRLVLSETSHCCTITSFSSFLSLSLYFLLPLLPCPSVLFCSYPFFLVLFTIFAPCDCWVFDCVSPQHLILFNNSSGTRWHSLRCKKSISYFWFWCYSYGILLIFWHQNEKKIISWLVTSGFFSCILFIYRGHHLTIFDRLPQLSGRNTAPSLWCHSTLR